ncbi:MAG: PAS domain-containing protein [Sedimentibacter sp.]|uniref:DUF438 domain-containing protein n=1 Tax=Sedimentibacter sp. TaxID=1960295 RepID=UPI0031597CA8
MYDNQERINKLKAYVKGLGSDADDRELYAEYRDYIDQVQPQDAFEVFKSLLDEGETPKDILIFLDKVINAFFKGLSKHSWKKPENDDFLNDMAEENKALAAKTDEIKILLKETDLTLKKSAILSKIRELETFDSHYLKKENILFPYMEKSATKFEGLTIMWSLHDEVRRLLKKAKQTLADGESSEQQVNMAIAALFFGILGVKKKEELILFPAACEVLSEQDWVQMHSQSLEYDFPFIVKERTASEEKEQTIISSDGIFRTETGEMNFDEILMVFNALPVDLTFVDEHNKVRYFTRPKDRIFPRSPAVIGRNVKNCHPSESVHVVEEIIESFRAGKEDNAKFWINIKGKTVLIQYFALRDNLGGYRGVLEVSQDITDIKNIDGERRLLTWDK